MRGDASPNLCSSQLLPGFQSGAGQSPFAGSRSIWTIATGYIVTELDHRRNSANDVSVSHNGEVTIRSFTDRPVIAGDQAMSAVG
jgi:hypothetical protein